MLFFIKLFVEFYSFSEFYLTITAATISISPMIAVFVSVFFVNAFVTFNRKLRDLSLKSFYLEKIARNISITRMDNTIVSHRNWKTNMHH
jgi:hypothetical protein